LKLGVMIGPLLQNRGFSEVY